jgi:hypothetical protein
VPTADADVPGPDGGAVDGGVPDGGAVDSGAPDPDGGMSPMPCEPGPSEIQCVDDSNGRLQGAVEFDWPGGDVFVFLDGFGNNAGAYMFQVTVTYPEGGQCGPDFVGYARCEPGTECLADGDRLTCQR